MSEMSDRRGNLMSLVLVFVLGILLVAIGVLTVVMPWGVYTSVMRWGWRFMVIPLGLGFAVLVPVVFLGLIALGVYYVVTGLAKTSGRRGDRALEILKERYAKGEITREEYLKMREELGS